MTTSGIFTLDLTLNEILIDAFDRLQIGADGETLDGDMFSRGKLVANLLIKHWQQHGIHLWTYSEGALFLQKGQPSYDFATANLANEFFETTTTVAASATDTAITVTSTDDMVAADTIGIILEDNSIFFTTIASLPGSNVVNLDDALTQAVSLGAVVYNYRDTFIPVSRILNVRRRESTNYEIPIIFKSREDYFDLPNKESQGTPLQAYYSRQRDNGIMFLWNTPSSAVPVIQFTYERQLQIFVTASDTMDLPQEWSEALISNISVKLIPKYGCSAALAAELKQEAADALAMALSYDQAVYPVTMDMQEDYG